MDRSSGLNNHWIAALVLLYWIRIVAGSSEVLCPPQWKAFGSSCYYLSHFSSSFQDARSMCGDLGGHLVQVENEEENDFLKALCTTYNIVPCAEDWELWLGLYRDEPCGDCTLNERRMNWYWVDLNMPLVWANWYDRKFGYSEPTGQEQCTRLWVENGAWGSKTCSEELMFVCERETLTTVESTTSSTTTTSIPTTSVFTTTEEASSETQFQSETVTVSVTSQFSPQIGAGTQEASTNTLAVVLGTLLAIVIIACVVGYVILKYRKTWYASKLDQGMYCTTMEAEVNNHNGSSPVQMDTDEGASPLTPHYEDEDLNIYETIPIGADDENCLNAKRAKSKENLAINNGPSTSHRHSNEYVMPEEMYSVV